MGRFEFGYRTNNEVQLSVQWPCDLEEGEEGFENLDIEAVLLLFYITSLKKSLTNWPPPQEIP
jgi:hypothetical protein